LPATVRLTALDLMKLTRIGLVAAFVALAVAGCGASEKTTTTTAATNAAKTAKAAAVTATATATATTAPKKTTTAAHRTDSDGNGIEDVMTLKGAVGDTLALEGSGLNDDVNDHTKTKIRVTLKAIKGPFTGFQIPSNRKLIGVVLQFTNTGKLRYDDALPSGQLSLKGGESGKQTNLIPVGGPNPCVDPSLKLKTGQAKNVCIAFEVPKRARAEAFEYVTDSGYGDTGFWTLH
jgi:hypothetical protein